MLMELGVETPRCLLIQRKKVSMATAREPGSHGPLRKDDIALICATVVAQEMLPRQPAVIRYLGLLSPILDRLSP